MGGRDRAPGDNRQARAARECTATPGGTGTPASHTARTSSPPPAIWSTSSSTTTAACGSIGPAPRHRRSVTRIELEHLESESIAPSAELRARLRKLTLPEP